MPQFHVLMLEDDPADAELIMATLRNAQASFSFSVVSDRTAFIAAMESQHVDLVLADYSLPNFDGISAIALVQSYDSAIPCILVSGVLGEERAIEALKSGATDYVLKDRLERLEPAFNRAIRERQERLRLSETAAALKASEERFRTSVEAMVDCLSILSAKRRPDGEIEDFVVKYLNTAACEYLSVSAKSQIGKPLYDVIPGFRSAIRNSLFYAFCFTVDSGNSFQEEMFLNPQNNSQFGNDISNLDADQAALMENLEPQFVALEMKASKLGDGIVITWRDITLQKQVEQQRIHLLKSTKEARNQAELANQFKDDFIATLSHELRTPLNAIDGWIQLASQKQAKPAVIFKAFEVIRRNTAMLERTISDLLDISRINQGKLTIDLQPIAIADFARLIADTVEAMNPTAVEKGIELISLFEPPLQSGHLLEQQSNEQHSPQTGEREFIAGDAARLQQIIWNLLSNAIKFTPSGETISVVVQEQKESVVLSVRDTGSGIDPAFLPHIFDRFQQADKNTSKSSSGVGIGLSIVQYVTEAHGGTIKAQSEGIGRGSLFTVSLPRKALSDISTRKPTDPPTELPEPTELLEPTDPPIEAATQPLKTEPPPYAAPSDVGQPQDISISELSLGDSLENVRVLIVEDQSDALDVFRLMMEAHKATVVVATSVPEALKKFRWFRPDVIVSDIGFPEETGYDLIREIRALPEEEGSRTPAVAISAYAETPYRTRALLAGFQMHIPKPIDLETLVTVVGQLTQKAREKQ
ncbi:MAG: response regulator [Phormidesmis sp.]